MRQLTFPVILILLLSCAPTRKASIIPDNLIGSWVPISQSLGDKELPSSSFGKQKLILSDSSYTVEAESIDKGIVLYNANKMDIYGKEGPNAGKHLTAIYQYENKQLTICYNLKGDGYPENFETKGHPRYFLAVFEKE